MAGWSTIPLGAGLYAPRSGRSSIERCTNLYAQPNKGTAKTPVTLYGTPGLKPWATIGEGAVRGMHVFGSDLYVVVGDTLYAASLATRTAQAIGVVGGVGAVRMTDNGVHVVVCTSLYAFAANRSVLLQLPEHYLSSCTYQDGQIIYTQRGTEKFFVSPVDDATTINALDFSSADAFADKLVAGISDHRQLVLLGENTVEFWENTGNPVFPFERSPGGFIEQGCRSPGSVAKMKNQVFWLGQDLTVYRAAGYQAEPISTVDISRLIERASTPESSEAFTYSQDGHTFYCLNFRDLSISYDITTGLWHERKSRGMSRWRAGSCVSVGSTILVGDCESNAVFELDLETFDEAGDELVRSVTSPPISADARSATMDEVWLDAEMGVGLSTGQGSEPTVMLDWSDDDGRTWSSEVRASLGSQGKYRNRATFSRLGQFESRTLRFSVSDPVRVAFLGAQARISVGMS